MRVKLDLVPKYLTAPQQMAFVDEEDQTVVEWINITGGIQFSPSEEYTLSIEALPISPTAREEEASALSNMAAISPLIAGNPKIMSLIVKSQPGRYSAQIAEILGGANPELEEAKALLAQMQQQLQSVMDAARNQIAQDQITIQTLKAVLTILRQQTQLLRTINQADKAEGKAEDPMLVLAEIHQKNIENQIRAYEAESERTYAKSDMMDSVSKFLNPPAPPTFRNAAPRLTPPQRAGA
jgi:hypothetical protein